MLRLPLAAWVATLGLASAATAWGPFTHTVVNELALPALRRSPRAAWLQDHDLGATFLRAGAAADLVFDVLRGRKTDPLLNSVLHSPGFLRHLVARAAARGDQEGLAFALGMVGHLAGDRVGNAADAVTTTNVFGFREDVDVFGDPVTDPSRSAAAQLRGVTISLNKVMIDALVWSAAGDGSHAVEVDEALLVEALQSWEGQPRVPNQTPAEKAALARNVEDLADTFRRSDTALRWIAWRLHRNRKLRNAVAAHLGGPGASVQGIHESARAVTAAVLEALEAGVGGLEAAVGGEDAAGAREGATASRGNLPAAHVPVPERGHDHGHELDHSSHGDAPFVPGWAVLLSTEGDPGRGPRSDSDSDPAAPGAVAPLVVPPTGALRDEATAAEAADRVPSSEAEALADLRKRIFKTFFFRALLPGARFPTVRREVRSKLPIPRPRPPPPGQTGALEAGTMLGIPSSARR